MEKVGEQTNPISYEAQIALFKTLGYVHDPEVTKAMILRDVYEMSWEEETEKYIENNPFAILYYTFGWRDPNIKNYNYSEQCIWFDLAFFDEKTQYQWFMERMGAITNGAIEFTAINIEADENKLEWISFTVNGKDKRWPLEQTGFVADHFVQRFSYLPAELKTEGKYTYFDNGGQQWVVDFASEEEQKIFKEKTGLEREWLGAGNRFSVPPKV